jgi:hypothetical protein
MRRTFLLVAVALALAGCQAHWWDGSMRPGYTDPAVSAALIGAGAQMIQGLGTAPPPAPMQFNCTSFQTGPWLNTTCR